METVFTVLARGCLKPTCLSYYDGWVASAAADASSGAWVVAVAYLPTSGSELVSVLKNSDAEIAPQDHPVSVHISDDCVLAVCLGTGGIRLYKLGVPLPPVPTLAVFIAELPVHAPPSSFLQARWIKESFRPRSLIACLRDVGPDRVVVYGTIPINSAREVMMTFNRGRIVVADASKSGNVAVLLNNGHLYAFTPTRQDGRFEPKMVDLQTLASPERPRVRQAISVAVGDRLVVVGYECAAPPRATAADGLVEAFNLKTGAMETRRCFSKVLPTALCTSGTRVMVGATTTETGQAGPLYAMIVSGPKTYTVCAGESAHQHWPAGTIQLDKVAWCYAKRVVHPQTGEMYAAVVLAKLTASLAQAS